MSLAGSVLILIVGLVRKLRGGRIIPRTRHALGWLVLIFEQPERTNVPPERNIPIAACRQRVHVTPSRKNESRACLDLGDLRAELVSPKRTTKR